MKHYVGLDVSMKETFVCVMDEAGKTIQEGRVKTDPGLIAGYLEKVRLKVGGFLPIEKIGIESGSLSRWLVGELVKLGLPTICIDARKMAAVLSIQVNKTDKNDARGIADAVRCGLYREVALKSQESIERGILMSSRRVLMGQKVELQNTVRGLLKAYGIRLGNCGEASFCEKVKGHLSKLPSLSVKALEGLLECFEHLKGRIEQLTKRVEEIAREDEEIRRLMTIPGVGVMTAVAYKVEIDDPRRFKKSRAVGAYLGMTPRQYSSGETTRQGAISKCGSKEVRSLLYEAAIVMLTRSQRWSKVKAWGLKITRRSSFRKAATAVGRKLSVVMHQMLINRTDFVYGEPKGTEGEKKGKTGLARAI